MWTFQIRPTDTQVSHEHVNVAWTSNLTLFCNTGGDATSLYLTGNTIQNHCKAPCQHLLTVNPPIGYNIAKRVWTLFAPFLRSLTHTNVFFLCRESQARCVVKYRTCPPRPRGPYQVSQVVLGEHMASWGWLGFGPCGESSEQQKKTRSDAMW